MSEERVIRFNEALREAIAEEMRRDQSVFIMGEDIGTYGGVFRISQGLLEEFGPERVRDTPISEAAIVGAAAGAALQGMRPVAEIMYMDFLPLAMDQLVNQVSMIPYVYGLGLPMVLRTQGGVGGSSTHHSKMLEAWLLHIPGIKIVIPATPHDAKGLLKSAIRDDDAVVFIENRHLYQTRGPVPAEEYLVPLGKAEVKRAGQHCTVVSWSRQLMESLAAAEELAKEGIEVEVVDLRSLAPLDMPTVIESVQRTGRLLVVHEAWRTGGAGAEVAAQVTEGAFEYLEAAPARLAGMDVPVPFSPALWPHTIPDKAKIAAAVRQLLKG